MSLPKIDGPVLETERLILRVPDARDFEAWAAFHADPITMEHLGGVQARSEAWRGLCGMTGSHYIRGFTMFSLILKDTDQWIGRIGPWQPDSWPGTEVGWGVAREYAGQGYAYEAAVATIDYAFDVLGWDDVMHTINPKNKPSEKLAAALGSKNRGRTALPAPYHEIEVYDWGQTKEEWRANANLRK